MRFVLAAGRALAWAAFALLLAASVYLRLGGSAPLVAIPTASMEPALRPGDLVLIRPVDPASVRPGQIVAVRVPALTRSTFGLPPLVVHRVLRRIGQGANFVLETKGDHNDAPDPFVTSPSNVAGAVARVFPGCGWPVLFVQSRWGFAFLLSLLGIYGLLLLGVALERAGGSARRLLLGPLVEGLSEPLRELEARLAEAQRGHLEPVSDELAQLRQAIALYAEHLQSHTRVVMEMADAATGLRQATEVLGRAVQAGVTSNPAPTPPPAGAARPASGALPSRRERKRQERHAVGGAPAGVPR
jgi:signal peptidase I